MEEEKKKYQDILNRMQRRKKEAQFFLPQVEELYSNYALTDEDIASFFWTLDYEGGNIAQDNLLKDLLKNNISDSEVLEKTKWVINSGLLTLLNQKFAKQLNRSMILPEKAQLLFQMGEVKDRMAAEKVCEEMIKKVEGLQKNKKSSIEEREE